MIITPLTNEHQAALQDYVTAFSEAGESRIDGYFGKPEWSHEQTVGKLDAWERGEDLGGWVQCTTRFLVSGGRILGNYNLRHELTETLMRHGGNCGYSVRPSERRKGHATYLLSHAKDLARNLGMDRMLLTCEPENLGSAKAIENNGGILQDVIHHEELGADIARYWIVL